MVCFVFFFFNDPATTEIYTLSLHDALPICPGRHGCARRPLPQAARLPRAPAVLTREPPVAGSPFLQPEAGVRSEEHTSELQSRQYLVCRLLLEKKKKKIHVKWTEPTSELKS